MPARLLRIVPFQKMPVIWQYRWSDFFSAAYRTDEMKEQLEFKWFRRVGSLRISGSRQRRNRCRWWFEQLRRAVEQAPNSDRASPCVNDRERPPFQNN